MNIWYDVISTATGLPTANDRRPSHPVSHARPAKPRRNHAALGLARRLLTDIGGAVSLSAFAKLRHWHRRGKAISELSALDDRTLQDIGVNRRSIRELVDAQLQAETADPRLTPAETAPVGFNLGPSARPCAQPC